MAGGPALHTAEMRLPGVAGSSFTYIAHLQKSQVSMCPCKAISRA